MNNNRYKIKIIKDGPYIISGNIPLSEKIITKKGRGYEYKDGKQIKQLEMYSLCRCGKSSNPPFCDGAHEHYNFNGTETASRDSYENRADILQGPEIDLYDDNRCAYARFCHREKGNVWELTENSDKRGFKEEAIIAASDCPAGRLVAVDKNGNVFEPDYTPAIEILQDPEEDVSGGIFVKGYIPIESCDGHIYEPRNRVALCRCGKSRNKPFCDATHVQINYKDK